MPAKTKVSVFTEAEVDMCLEEAAAIRGSYLGITHTGNPVRLSKNSDEYAEEKAWEALACKLAKEVGLKEFEKECNRCKKGKVNGHKCLECLGTGLWPPTKKRKRKKKK